MLEIRIASSSISLLLNQLMQQMARKRTPCVVGAPRTYHHHTNIASACHALHISFPPHLFQPPYASSRSRLLFLLLLALRIVQAHTSVYVCAQKDALPRSRASPPASECNN